MGRRYTKRSLADGGGTGAGLPAAAPDESERLARVARVLAAAEASFGSAEKAGRWLRRPSRGLRGEVPLDLADTGDGARRVEEKLTRIASGDLA